ncbi:MAG: LuxR C-terminal-related transcriptional regulator [Treponema sp.]|nr:LuxR C-terminal-related transcriptional regulator [Treponema sp.]
MMKLPNYDTVHAKLTRQRVERLLENAVQKPVVFVVAGAGYGKTQAVYTFAQKHIPHTAWLQISQLDNIEERFWETMISAVSLISKETADKLRRYDFPVTEQQFQQCLSVFRKNISLGEKYLFVYDDVHFITNKIVLRFLSLFLRSAPPNITCILLSRSEQAFDVESLAGKKMFAKITTDDLRFSREEMLSYFDLLNIKVEPAVAAFIYRDTEGWVFAIHLACILLINTNKRTTRVLRLLNAGVSNLLESEIMEHLSQKMRRLLIKFSLVENLHMDLALEIAKDYSAVKKLESLSSFISFDEYLGLYRIHNLLLEFLREKQDELSEEEKIEVWQKSAKWCVKNNHKMDALVYYDKSKDYGGIVEILKTLPLILANNLARFVLDIFDRCDTRIYSESTETIVIRNRALTTLGCYQQSWDETVNIISDAELQNESPEKHGILTGCYMQLGFIGLLKSIDTKKYDFAEYFKRAASHSEKSEYITKPPINGIVLSTYACRIMSLATSEDLEKYVEMIKEIVPYTSHAMSGCQEGLIELCFGEIYFFKMKLKKSEKYLLASIEKAKKAFQFEIENRALFYLMRIYLFTGDKINVEYTLKKIKTNTDEDLFLNRSFYHDILMSWYYIQTGKINMAAAWLKNDFNESEFNFLHQGLERLIRAKYYLSVMRYPVVLAVIKSPQEAESIFFGDIEIKALEAVCKWRLQKKESAFLSLYQAFELSEPTGSFMPFVELGKDMRGLSEAALKEAEKNSETEKVYIEWLKEINRKSAAYAKKLHLYKKSGNGDFGKNMNMRLSRREMHVLSGLSSGLTRLEIASAASISPNTVKSAIRSIFSKFGALNKADAVRIAIEKGILKTEASQNDSIANCKGD